MMNFLCANANRRQTRGKCQRGFSMVEVMVALAIVAIALPALITEINGYIDATSHTRDKSFATWVAQNELARQQAEYRLTEEFLKGTHSSEVEMGGRTWYFEIVSEETQQEGMWRQTVSVGKEPTDYSLVTVVGYLSE